MRTILPVLAAFVISAAALAQPAPLYEAQAIVTGTDMRERPAGLGRCLTDVLVKVSGAPALRDDPRVAALAARAGALVEDFDYRDRMSDRPMMDEQGSRDRPYTLTCRFAPRKVDAALARLGSRPWRGERPRLLAHVTMTERGGDSYALAADTVKGDRPRASLLDAAARVGLRVTLPLTDAPPPRGLVPLEGVLRWSDADLGWVAEWSLLWQQRRHRWRIAGVSFDEAFRNGTEGAAAILSGHARR